MTQRSLVQIQPPQPTSLLRHHVRVTGKTYFVYVLWSERSHRFYIGISENPRKRLDQHNRARKSWTSRHRPWTLVLTESYENYTGARKRGIELKSQNSGRGFYARTGLNPAGFTFRSEVEGS
ncbi:MAG: hypothetical protein DMG23_06200 [Acidobacteria bacterium]|nr:MAG: hypothetical protein DMG23_06200 [Acidobacteriota bacterium]